MLGREEKWERMKGLQPRDGEVREHSEAVGGRKRIETRKGLCGTKGYSPGTAKINEKIEKRA